MRKPFATAYDAIKKLLKNLFGKKEPVVEEPTETTAGEASEEGASSEVADR